MTQNKIILMCISLATHHTHFIMAKWVFRRGFTCQRSHSGWQSWNVVPELPNYKSNCLGNILCAFMLHDSHCVISKRKPVKGGRAWRYWWRNVSGNVPCFKQMKHNFGKWKINGIHLKVESLTEKLYGKDIGVVLRMVGGKDSQVTETSQILPPY